MWPLLGAWRELYSLLVEVGGCVGTGKFGDGWRGHPSPQVDNPDWPVHIQVLVTLNTQIKLPSITLTCPSKRSIIHEVASHCSLYSGIFPASQQPSDKGRFRAGPRAKSSLYPNTCFWTQIAGPLISSEHLQDLLWQLMHCNRPQSKGENADYKWLATSKYLAKIGILDETCSEKNGPDVRWYLWIK